MHTAREAIDGKAAECYTEMYKLRDVFTKTRLPRLPNRHF